MKYLLIGTIKLYWLLVPSKKRKRCLFRKSCSKAVYDEAEREGFLKALGVFSYRLKNCRPGYELYINPIDNSKQLILSSKERLSQNEIADWMLK